MNNLLWRTLRISEPWNFILGKLIDCFGPTTPDGRGRAWSDVFLTRIGRDRTRSGMVGHFRSVTTGNINQRFRRLRWEFLQKHGIIAPTSAFYKSQELGNVNMETFHFSGWRCCDNHSCQNQSYSVADHCLTIDDRNIGTNGIYRTVRGDLRIMSRIISPTLTFFM